MTISDSSNVANVTIATLIIAAVIVSSTINPGLLRCYFRQKRTFQRNMFITVAFLDMFTTNIPAIIHAYNLSRSEELEYIKSYHCILGCISQAVAVLLATTRLSLVLFPLHALKTRVAIGYLVVYSVVMTTVNIFLALHNQDVDVVPTIHYQIPGEAEFLEFLCWGYTFTQATVGIFSSFVAVLYLFFLASPTGDKSKKKQGAITILLMNIPYAVNIFFTAGAFWFTDVFEIEGADFGDLQYAAVPILISGYNPVVILLRKRSYRTQILSDTKRCCNLGSNRANTFGSSTKANNDTIVTAM